MKCSAITDHTGPFPNFAEVPMHSPSKTHKQATHTDREPLQDRSWGRWLARLACMHAQEAVRAMSGTLEEVRSQGQRVFTWKGLMEERQSQLSLSLSQ